MAAAAVATSATLITQKAPCIDELLAGTTASILRPYQFFCSWQGVLTLAYTGFPEPLTSLKAKLSELYPVNNNP